MELFVLAPGDNAQKPQLIQPDELLTLASGCDLLVLPTSPDALALGATLPMVDALKSLQTSYKILLTLIPPPPNRSGDDARAAIAKTDLPIFTSGIISAYLILRFLLEILAKVPLHTTIRRRAEKPKGSNDIKFVH